MIGIIKGGIIKGGIITRGIVIRGTMIRGIDTIEIDVNEGDEVIIGADLGCFHMGGSAMIILTPEHYISKGNDMKFPSNKMLSQKKISIRADIACSSLCEFEFKIGIGEKLLQQEQNSRDK